ncbi:MAG: endonuclease MutS2 [Candidatus Eisenbacteria bacterium]|nr:endonuclease MutS2 [Candidatus Eisenbacteria bacterium]
MDTHSLEVLELHKIIALAERKAQSVPGREAVAHSQPLLDPEAVERQLHWTTELREILASCDVPSLDFPDARPQLEKVHVEGSILEPAELLGIARLLSVAASVVRFFKPRNLTSPLSWACVENVKANEELRRKIESSIDPSGELLDSASPALRNIRREIERNREKARGVLERSLESLGSPPESFLTLRNDRYMVLIPSQARKKLKGIVHDQSGSGAGIYFEPLQAVDVNNALSNLSGEEKEEKLRILRELSLSVRGCAAEFRQSLSALARLDAVFARARLSNEMGATCPRVSENGTLRIRGGRHPLLLIQGKEKGYDVEPLNLEMGGGFRILLISGPNMGGKTVALKTVGLLSLMMRCGFHLPAGQGTEIPIFTRVFCDIGDEQSIEEQLSTFASHMRNVAGAVNEADSSSLVLIDELGAGTDPLEGAALAKAVLEELERRNAMSVTTTHLGLLKNFVASNRGMRNASMVFDPRTHEPLYRLEVGIPGQSRALETAARMGISKEVIERAVASLSEEEREMSALLSELETLRREVERDKEVLEKEGRRLSELAGEYEKKMAAFEGEKRELRAHAAREAKDLVAEAKSLVRSVKEEIKVIQKKPAEVARLKRAVEQVETKLTEDESSTPQLPSMEPLNVKPGMKVWAYDIGSAATVVAGPDAEGRVKVERKGVRIDTHVSRITKAPEDGEPKERATVITSDSADGFSSTLNLRGLLVDEALESVDRFLDAAFLRGLSQVTIIHGKGKGILRQKVQQALTGYTFVKSHRLGGINEGGVGVTVVELST